MEAPSTGLRTDNPSTTFNSVENRKRFQRSPPGRSDPSKKTKITKIKRKKAPKEGGTEEVLEFDIQDLLAPQRTNKEVLQLPTPFSTLELEISTLSSTGDGLALHNGRVYVVPFSLPGDVISAKVIRHNDTHTVCDFLSVVRASPDRDESLVRCKYFASCSGCQLQILSYKKQLEHKRGVVEKAYAHFSELTSKGLLPTIGPTIGSPLQYNYRTKLTPHFDGPRKGGFNPDLPPPPIGFNFKGRRNVLDIEDCPIGVDSVRAGIMTQRKYVHENLSKYKRGATLLLRESTIRTLNPITAHGEIAKVVEEKTCITDSNATSTEYIDDYKFTSPAGAFFQNNNSILPIFTAYVRENLLLPPLTPAASHPTIPTPPKYLVDAYCGSGLFTITCGSTVQKAIGVDISANSIAYATQNALANNVTNASFITGDAEKIFADIDFPGVETSCIIDPPRKGCDHPFLNQLLNFRPKRIVYVSCNVHTQARDLDYILTHKKGLGYRIDSVRGFDFFPQTHHVESVAVLTWLDEIEADRQRQQEKSEN